MKLRNKKTGRIVECKNIVFAHCNAFALDFEQYSPNVNSLAELNEEWEDYEPKEPLIKDEKIRKAVRAWWETIPDAVTDKRVLYKNNHEFEIGIYRIYCGAIYSETLKKCRFYTIAELCGEEK